MSVYSKKGMKEARGPISSSVNCRFSRSLQDPGPARLAWHRQIICHMENNSLIDSNHIGSVKNRSSVTALLDLHTRISKLKNQKKNAALILMDLSLAYDVISYQYLEEKLKIIGIHNKYVKMIMSLLDNRKQYVELNPHQSDLLLTGPISVCQGTVLAGLFYLIYTLDIHCQPHNTRH